MAGVVERLGALVEQHLGIADRALLDAPWGELGVNSMDGVAFLKTVAEEFGVSITPGVATGLSTMRDLIAYVERNM